jgi:uncharacterized damage-inducible protein DinB
MGEKARELARQLEKFNGDLIDFVEKCTAEDWGKVCSWEQWSVGVTARHIGAVHYDALQMVRRVIDGESFPEMDKQQVTEAANQHAREHADCTKPEVLEILRRSGREMVQFVDGLDDSELDRTGYLPAIDGDITAGRFIENVVLKSGARHFENMKSAVGK